MMDTRLAIGQLARQTGYSAAMIRYFEKHGVITPAHRNPAGYRLFELHHVKELKFVAEMQALGFYAEHIKSLREIKSSQSTAAEKRAAIKRVFEEHLKYVEEKASHLNALIARLESVEGQFVDQVLADGH